MELQQHRESMLAFIEKERPYVDAIATRERRGGGMHPLYGNDEDAECASEGFFDTLLWLKDNEPQEGESYEAYTARLEKGLASSHWFLLPRFERLRKAWYQGDFTLGESRYDLYGVERPQRIGFSMDETRADRFLAELREELERSETGDDRFLAPALKLVEELRTSLVGADLGILLADLEARERTADHRLGRFYRELEGREGAWSEPEGWAEAKAEAKAYAAALKVGRAWREGYKKDGGA